MTASEIEMHAEGGGGGGVDVDSDGGRMIFWSRDGGCAMLDVLLCCFDLEG
jgi:hypothetical protein